MTYLVHPAAPVDEGEAAETQGMSDEIQSLTLDLALGIYVIVSNTCDVLGDYHVDDDRYLILAPLQPSTNADVHKLANGRSALYFAFPDRPEGPVWLDVRTLVTITKSATALAVAERSPLSSADLNRLQSWLGSRFARVGFPDDFDAQVVKPIRRSLSKMFSSDDTLRQVHQAIIFIGIAHTDKTGRATLLLLADLGRVKIEEAVLAAAGKKVYSDLRGRIAEAGGTFSVDVRCADATKVTAAELLAHRPLAL